MRYKHFKISKRKDPGILAENLNVHFNPFTLTIFFKKVTENGHRKIDYKYLGSFMEIEDDPGYWHIMLPVRSETEELFDKIKLDNNFIEYQS